MVSTSGDASQKPSVPEGLFISAIVLLLTSTFSVTCNVDSIGLMRLNNRPTLPVCPPLGSWVSTRDRRRTTRLMDKLDLFELE